MSNNANISFKQIRRIFEHALAEAKFSPDDRRRVGAVLTDSSLRIISMGHNAKPTTSKSYHSCVNPVTGKSCQDLLHAEERALLIAGVAQSRGGYLFVTHCPCIRCVGKIAEAGIKRVYFLEEHDGNEGAILLKNDYGIETIQVVGVRRSIDRRNREKEEAEELDEDALVSEAEEEI